MGRWVVIRQVYNTVISEREMKEALYFVDPDPDLMVIPCEIPSLIEKGQRAFKNANWNKLGVLQEAIFETQMSRFLGEPESRIAYFGLAPIPLILHLGHLLGDARKVYIFQKDHKFDSWVWPNSDVGQAPTPRIEIEKIKNASYGRSNKVALLLATSYRVHEELISFEDHAEVIKINTNNLDPDLFLCMSQLQFVSRKVGQEILQIDEKYERLEKIDFYASIPGGLAFSIGQRIAPTIYPKIQTFQFYRNHEKSHVKSILLNG